MRKKKHPLECYEMFGTGPLLGHALSCPRKCLGQVRSWDRPALGTCPVKYCKMLDNAWDRPALGTCRAVAEGGFVSRACMLELPMHDDACASCLLFFVLLFLRIRSIALFFYHDNMGWKLVAPSKRPTKRGGKRIGRQPRVSC